MASFGLGGRALMIFVMGWYRPVVTDGNRLVATNQFKVPTKSGAIQSNRYHFLSKQPVSYTQTQLARPISHQQMILC